MLYLEDYLEMIEHLPEELRRRFTEMRELDLQVQNAMDSLEKRVRFFFSNAKKMKPAEKEAEFEAIRKDYYKPLEDSDEKVKLASKMYDIVARYLKRLDQETLKFKLELEADHIGITEILEKRSHEMDTPTTNSSQKENRYNFPNQRSHHNEFNIKKRRDSNTSDGHNKRLAVNSSDRVITELRVNMNNPSVGPVAPPPQPTVAYTLGHHIGAGGTAIAAAASQAIVATQQMQQGRRTASLKASYEAIHSGSSANAGGSAVGSSAQEISISKELAGAAQTAIAAIQDNHKKHKKKSSLGPGTGTPPVASPASLPSPQEAPQTAQSSDKADTYDPNEPRYCICNEVAFGMMVACDNKSCPYEWYHYPCVGITEKPKGKWYCPHCTAVMKKNRTKKN
ncbi:inhibitor of growth protein 3-like [Cimex lectularius]|uniref:Inhibitor of growth protein n=1 Tax=Cimex lectularius TaxID=79782 RepID=A0A8I6SF69_CIMLE|nr:inhibitor of growth protein 3-like [Cimex lectularius]